MSREAMRRGDWEQARGILSTVAPSRKEGRAQAWVEKVIQEERGADWRIQVGAEMGDGRGMGTMEENGAQIPARRMKGKGMSRAERGADAMAKVRELLTNGELNQWCGRRVEVPCRTHLSPSGQRQGRSKVSGNGRKQAYRRYIAHMLPGLGQRPFVRWFILISTKPGQAHVPWSHGQTTSPMVSLDHVWGAYRLQSSLSSYCPFLASPSFSACGSSATSAAGSNVSAEPTLQWQRRTARRLSGHRPRMQRRYCASLAPKQAHSPSLYKASSITICAGSLIRMSDRRRSRPSTLCRRLPRGRSPLLHSRRHRQLHGHQPQRRPLSKIESQFAARGCLPHPLLHQKSLIRDAAPRYDSLGISSTP